MLEINMTSKWKRKGKISAWFRCDGL